MLDQLHRTSFTVSVKSGTNDTWLDQLALHIHTLLQKNLASILLEETQKNNILVIGSDTHWSNSVEKALESNGRVYRTKSKIFIPTLWFRKYALVVVDIEGQCENDIANIARNIIRYQANTHIVFASTFLNWRTVREAFRNGAANCIFKSYDIDYIASELNPYLKPQNES